MSRGPAGSLRNQNGKDVQEPLQQCWGIWFAVSGDLRFLSHHETMRTIERIAIRSGLALKYSQGFNPRPVLSFPLARPVGVATREDLFVLRLAGPEQAQTPATGAEQAPEAHRLLDRLNAQAPEGLMFLRAMPLRTKHTPQPIRCHYELPLPGEQRQAVRAKLASLEGQGAWPVRRLTPAKASPRRRQARERTIDLKELIEAVRLEANALKWTAKRRGALWPRPTELLRLLGLEENTLTADIVRTGVEYSASDGAPVGSAPAGDRPRSSTDPPTKE